MKPQVRSIALRYGGAVLFVTAAILVTWTTPLRMRAPYLLLLTAAMLTSSIGGLLPGLVSALVVVGASLYFYVPWNTPLTYDSIPDLLGIVGFPLAAILIAGLTTAREQAEQAARTRARQQAAVANLGMQALAARDLTTLLDSAAGVVRETLGVDYCKVLKLLPGGA
jgi:K+-sensing histidine kinase KdpD